MNNYEIMFNKMVVLNLDDNIITLRMTGKMAGEPIEVDVEMNCDRTIKTWLNLRNYSYDYGCRCEEDIILAIENKYGVKVAENGCTGIIWRGDFCEKRIEIEIGSEFEVTAEMIKKHNKAMEKEMNEYNEEMLAINPDHPYLMNIVNNNGCYKLVLKPRK